MKCQQIARIGLSVLFLITTTGSAFSECGGGGGTASPLPNDLTSVGLRDLLNFDIEVTSPAKKPQRVSEVASAIYVITQEDIHRSGANSVPELLRIVPGINVARVDSNRWAITSRGFNSAFADKLLVLLDGQSIFTPSINGVFWDEQELVLEDIDRIEVIRGPGAAIWGSNAVNGVINIITCAAHKDEKNFVTVGGGTEEKAFGSFRTTTALSDETFVKVFGRSAHRDDSHLAGGGDADDAYENSRGGFRLDSKLSANDALFFKGEGFYEDKNYSVSAPALTPPFVDSESYSGARQQYGANAIAKWTHTIAENNELSFLADYAYEGHDGLVYPFNRNTVHTEFNHRWAPSESHDLTYGLEYRLDNEDFRNNFADAFEDDYKRTHLYSLFIQDEYTLIPEKLRLTVGSRFEHYDPSDLEYMPNVRALWTVNPVHSFWGAVSRAVVNPSRVTRDVISPIAAFPTDSDPPLPALVTLQGNNDVSAQYLMAYELGYRAEISPRASVDLALFYNDYDNSISSEPQPPFVGTLEGQSQPALIIPLQFNNSLTARSYGGEVALRYAPVDNWQLITSYSYIHLRFQQGLSADTANSEFF
jgi:iron complex outermembrane receptor protein